MTRSRLAKFRQTLLKRLRSFWHHIHVRRRLYKFFKSHSRPPDYYSAPVYWSVFIGLLLIILFFPIFLKEELGGGFSPRDGNKSRLESGFIDFLRGLPDHTSFSDTEPTSPVSDPSISSPLKGSSLPNSSNAGPILYSAAFEDNFTSAAFFDFQESGLYRDNLMTALIFPPDYNWRALKDADLSAAEKEYFSSLSINDFARPGESGLREIYERRCFKNNCLEQRGERLFYNDSSLNFSAPLSGAEIAAVSIGSLEKSWLVGFTLKDKDGYQGRVFRFDGQNFQEILPGGLRSPYFGRFGFGGEEDDFLIIYSAYEGQAYHVKNSKLTDISRFFHIRVTDDGFKPEVIKSGRGDNSTWYVYSLSRGWPRFMKLWQNKGPEIVGALVLNGPLLPSGTAEIALKVKEDDFSNSAINILARLKDQGGNISWQLFSDYGFKNRAPAEIHSFLLGTPGVPIKIKKISRSHLALDEPSADKVKLWFALSDSSGQPESDWQDISQGRNMTFETDIFSHYLLKISFDSAADKFYSPFLSSASFDYQFNLAVSP